MRDPCPWCGLPGIAMSSVDNWTLQIVRDIRNHACSAWATPPVMTSEPTDTSFIREARNSPEGLKAWREALR